MRDLVIAVLIIIVVMTLEIYHLSTRLNAHLDAVDSNITALDTRLDSLNSRFDAMSKTPGSEHLVLCNVALEYPTYLKGLRSALDSTSSDPNAYISTLTAYKQTKAVGKVFAQACGNSALYQRIDSMSLSVTEGQ